MTFRFEQRIERVNRHIQKTCYRTVVLLISNYGLRLQSVLDKPEPGTLYEKSNRRASPQKPAQRLSTTALPVNGGLPEHRPEVTLRC
jgi:hypothetical protein